jgi:hypothetical protein
MEPATRRQPPTGFVEIVGMLRAIVGGGALAGAALALVTAPGSSVALAVCAFTLPLAFGLGLSAWRGLLGAWLMTILGRSMLRSRGDEGRFREETKRAFGSIRDAGPGGLPFTWVFVPVAALVGVTAGLALFLIERGTTTLASVALPVAATVYGTVLRRLAREGRMPLPAE